jgi:exonuclease III
MSVNQARHADQATHASQATHANHKTQPQNQNFYFSDTTTQCMQTEFSLSIYQHNVRGISDVLKFNSIISSIKNLKCKIDIIALCEVKLKSNFPLNLYILPGYNQFSCLRGEQGGGGVLCFIHESIEVESYQASNKSFEKLCFKLNLGKMKMRLVSYYRAPINENLNEFLHDLESELSQPDINTCIVGDLNIDHREGQSNDRANKEYSRLIASYNFEVSNTLPTRQLSGKTIDHFLTNMHSKQLIRNCTIEVDPTLSDHSAILTSLDHARLQKRESKTLTIKKTNFNELCESFVCDENGILASSDADFVAESLISAIKDTITRSTNEKTFNVKHEEKINDWTSLKGLKLLAEKNKLLTKRRKKPNSDIIKHKLKCVSHELDQTARADYKNYINKQCSTRDSKKLWKNLNQLLGRRQVKSKQIKLKVEGVETNDPETVANSLNEFFSTCAATLHSRMHAQSEIQQVEKQFDKSMFLHPVSEQEIMSTIKRMKNNSAAGHDGIGVKHVKVLAPRILKILVHLANTIFLTGNYPACLKIAVVTALHKAGSTDVANNYRPISVLPILNKVIERVLHQRLLTFSSVAKIISSHQFGFRPRSGTENAAIELNSAICNAIDKGKTATAIFMDLSKAFDIVDHKLLLQVLEKYGVRGLALNVFKSYLSGRKQIVKANDVRSKEATVTQGVVQGSCLGPLLFILFFNAIASLELDGQLFMFADDVVLLNIHDKKCTSTETAVNDMNKVIEFFNHRKLILNPDKTFYMIFSSSYNKIENPKQLNLESGMIIKREKCCKYLGLLMDEHLRWNEHISHVEKKVSSCNAVLWKMRRLIPQKSKILIYDTLAQSHLMYMSPTWGLASGKAITTLQVLQNRALRNVYDIPRETSRINLYTHQVGNHLPIRGICAFNIAKYVFNVKHKSTHSNIILSKPPSTINRSLRSHKNDDLQPAAFQTNYGSKSIDYIGPRVFSAIPRPVRESRHQHAFKWTLKCHLRNEKFVQSCFDSSFFELQLQ